MLRGDPQAAGISYVSKGPDGPPYADFPGLRRTYSSPGGRAEHPSGGHLLMPTHKCRIDVHAQARPGRDFNFAIDDFERGSAAVESHAGLEPFEFVIGCGIGEGRNKMHHVE